MVPAEQSQLPASTATPSKVFGLSQGRPPGRCEHSGRYREFMPPPLHALSSHRPKRTQGFQQRCQPKPTEMCQPTHAPTSMEAVC